MTAHSWNSWEEEFGKLTLTHLGNLLQSLQTLNGWKFFSDAFAGTGIDTLQIIAKNIMRQRVEEICAEEDKEKEISSAVSEMYSWGQNACGDMASGGFEHTLENEIKADEYWDDPDMLSDLFGDRIYDATTTFRSKYDLPQTSFNFIYNIFCRKMKRDYRFHAALVKTMDGLIMRHQ